MATDVIPDAMRPVEGLPYKVTGPEWDGWGVAYWGSAKTPTCPNEEYNSRKCWRWCHNEDPITSEVTTYIPYALK